MNYLDLIIIGILMINVLMGFFRGFVKPLINILSLIVAFLVTKYFYAQFLMFLNNNFNLTRNIKSNIIIFLGNMNLPETFGSNSINNLKLEGKLTALKPFIIKFLEDKNLDIISSVSFVQKFSDWVSTQIATLFSVLLLFLAIVLIIRIVGVFIDKIFTLPVFRGINKTAGVIFGILKGLLESMLIIVLITLFAPVFGGEAILESLNKSVIAVYFYKYNIFMVLFQTFKIGG